MAVPDSVPLRGSCGTKMCSWLLAPRGPSGHSYFRKGRFALSLFSVFNVFTVVGGAKDIFLEKFGVDATVMGVLWAILTFWGPVANIIHGRLQDRQLLASYFPVGSWGRRAPWLLTHGIVAVAAASVMYIPPDQGSTTVLYVWFMVISFSAYWGSTSCIIAFEAARQELYPFKEERIVVEALCKYACMFGGGSGGPVLLVVMTDPSLNLRLACMVWILLMGVFTLQAVPVFQEANVAVQKANTSEASILWEMLPSRSNSSSDALRHLMAMKFWNGAYGGSVGGMLLYYVTYVLKLSGYERLAVIAMCAMAAGLTETVLNLVYVTVFGSGDGREDITGRLDRLMLNSVVLARLANAAATVVLLGVAPPSVPVFFTWCIISRVFLCGMSFWRVSAACWLVDEDCLRDDLVENREGTIFGALAMTQNFAGAIFSSIAFLGLGLAGLETENCVAYCAADDKFDQTSQDCADQCLQNVIEAQPASLRIYIQFVLAAWAPFCELLVALHAYSFPIKDARLRKLQNSVQVWRDARDELTDPSSLCASSLPKPIDEPAVVKAHVEKAFIGVGACHDDSCKNDCADDDARGILPPGFTLPAVATPSETAD